MTITHTQALQTEPLEPTIGSRVHGVDLHRPLGAATVAEVRAALLESDALLAFLRGHASHVTYQFRHRWTAGDLVVWDNRASWHYAVDDCGHQVRSGYKISVEGGDWRPETTRQ